MRFLLLFLIMKVPRHVICKIHQRKNADFPDKPRAPGYPDPAKPAPKVFA
jgi:hypothetical protein